MTRWRRARFRATAGFAAAVLAAANSASAKPKPTPLAPLEPMPVAGASARAEARMLPVDRSRLVPVGDFRLEVRDDGVVEGVTVRALATLPHRFGLRTGCLLYRVDGHEVFPAGVARVVELHPLGEGRERVVMTVAADVATIRFPERPTGRYGSPRIDWEPGTAPPGHRYFVHPDNLTGMPEADYRRLTAGKLWVGMPSALVRMALGRPDRVEPVETRFGTRERWTYPVHHAHSRWLFLAGGQLASWRDTWSEPDRPSPPGSILSADRWF